MLSDDKLFAAKLVEGDAKAFECLFKTYYARLVIFANKFVNDIEASEEIVSDTFVMLWENVQDIGCKDNIASYLYKCVQNRALNYLKHQKIENLYVNYLEKQQLLNTDDLTAEGTFIEKEMMDQINVALNNLPDKCRQIFMMSRFEHMKYKDIAAKLNLSPKTVERQISIALDKLRRIFKPEYR